MPRYFFRLRNGDVVRDEDADAVEVYSITARCRRY